MATNFSKELIVKPGHKVQLRKFDPGDTLGWDKGHATKASLAKALARLDKLQYLLYADHKHALLVVLQGLDAAGKDGTDSPCNVWRQSAGLPRDVVQDAFARGGRARFSVARAQSGAAVRRYRHLQPVALRRCADRARAQSGAEGRVVAALRANQPVRGRSWTRTTCAS